MTHEAGVRRAVDVLLRAQSAGPGGVSMAGLAAEWGVHERTVRRLAAAAIDAAERHTDIGQLLRIGRGRAARLVWTPARPPRDVHASEAMALLAALGPWSALGHDDITNTLERLLASASRSTRATRRRHLERLARTGLWYQPFGRRPHRDPDALDQVLSALLYGRELRVGRYSSPEEPARSLVLQPWTLVHAYDGLYVLGPEVDEGGGTEPRMWALHRMEEVRFLRDRGITVPGDYDPSGYLGHGYGPFLGEAGTTELFVPDAEAPYVLEYQLPSQVGEPQPVEGGWRVVLGTGVNWGIRLWARWMGVEVVE